MNSKIISACMNPGDVVDDIKRVIVKEIIDKYLSLDDVVYDGNVISAYELKQILDEKMNYIKELSDPDNYKIYRKIKFKIRRKSEIGYKYFCQSRCNLKNVNYFFLDIDFNMYGDIYVNVRFFMKDNKLCHEIRGYCNYEISRLPVSIEAYEIVNDFIENNEEVVLELLLILEDIYNVVCNNLRTTKIEENINYKNVRLNFLFDVGTENSMVLLYILDGDKKEYDLEKLGLSNYLDNKREDLLKKIGVSIKELNSFYKSEIEKYYNSINPVSYKRRK